MSFYVVSVQPRREEHFIRAAERLGAAGEMGQVAFHWPRRKLVVRKKGRKTDALHPVFPGYVFVSADEITDSAFAAIKRLPGFYRFLESNDRIRALNGRDEEIVSHFVKLGDVIGKSLVSLNADQRIQVLRGPLKGLEGLIVRVDRRKQRAKVRLDLYDESFLVDFGFELLAPGETGEDRRTGG